MINMPRTSRLGIRSTMTFSLLALDRATGSVGCAAATGNLAVGAWVLRAAAGVGAVASQGLSASTLWGDEALARLARGERADDVVAALTDADSGRDFRQLAVLDARGGAAAWTGSRNEDEKGHIIAPDYIIAGNWLSAETVLSEMDRTYRDSASAVGLALGERLLRALEAAVEAGSDSRGTLSAAIRIVRPDCAPLDLRVDYDEDPVPRLRALYEMATSPPYSDWAGRVPTLEDPYRC